MNTEFHRRILIKQYSQDVNFPANDYVQEYMGLSLTIFYINLKLSLENKILGPSTLFRLVKAQ